MVGSRSIAFGDANTANPQAALENIRTARLFLASELGPRSSNSTSKVGRAKIADLLSQTDRPPNHAQAEATHFWNSLSDGTLLCLLVNRLRPGSIDQIDQTDAAWVKVENISRFLRAARDHLGLPSQDLFQTFDITDCTLQGLLRVTHTMSVIQKAFRRKSDALRTSTTFKIQPRTTSMTPPTTPRSRERKELAAEDSPHAEPTTPKRSSRNPELPPSSPPDLSAKPVASISFADSVKSGGEEPRLPYRDRKLSESAVNLTGVAEEEPEDLMTSTEASKPLRFSTSAAAFPLTRGSSSDSDKAFPFVTAKPSLARSTSQKRISQELALGQLPRGIIGSADNLGDHLSFSSSPLQQGPSRRHSARAQPGPSLLNPSRDALLALGSSDTSDSAPPVPRLPFPRTAVPIDSPGARRLGKHLSMNSGDSPPSLITSSSAGNTADLMKGRPNFRHARYSSDLHLPTVQRYRAANRSPDPSSDGYAPRTRFDSEVGSIYSNTLGSLTSDDLGSVVTSRSGRDAAQKPKHKLVVTEEGKADVTYQLGNCIGRGQFGSVYRALNLNSGRMVAVKRIKLDGRSDEDVTELMNEVDLLKSLIHPSIVKYEGLVRGPEVVSIILEYVENGSLLHTLKSFGNFPEKLVASYVVKILEGLNYLHEQNVAHCDLKAANILTTKNGNVKLSDFGVSLNLKAVKEMGRKNDAIGTPNWMAPEVIELKGVTVAADIWSLACTIIELLTGKPPYYDMLAMSAMFRIVEDDCPPIPECSPHLHDLLLQCFNKDATKRPSAEMLFEHTWVQQVWTGNKELRELRPQDSVPFLRRISADMRRLDPRMFEVAGQQQPPPMERATSHPAEASPHRPMLDILRSNTDPAANMSPSMQTLLLPQLSDSDAHLVLDGVPQSPVSPTTVSPPLPTDEYKAHAFVKSSFSKAVMCKICREPVKKHAVLCEECGLMCHARCAVQAPPLCNIRAQLFFYQHHDQLSPPSSSTGHGPASPTMAGAALPSTTGFKFPFGMRRESKASSIDPNTSAEIASNTSQEVAPSSSPQTKIGKDSPPVRKRRISLIPSRYQSTPPKPEAAEISLSTNNSSSPSIVLGRGVRRHSSLSYGSLSGNSSISSGGGAIKSPCGQLGALNVTSTPVLPQGIMSFDEKVAQNRFRRQLSSGPALVQARTQSTHISVADLTLETAAPTTLTPMSKHDRKLERKKSRRASSKAECIIM